MRVNRSWGPRFAAAVVMIGAPVMWASSASAQPSATVVFTGGCASEFVGPQTIVVPEPRETTIPAGATVRLVNRLGTAGTLSLDGEPAAELPTGAEVEVRLHAGTLAATMEIECADDDTATATATVRTGPASQAPSTAQPAGAPSGDPDDEDGGPGETPATGGPSPAATGPGATAGPSAGSTGAAPEPVPASAGGGPGDQPNSALALVAAACVAGVLAAAIRAFAARRSTRTEWT